ncbi:MAG: JDVT-CTERM system glutamic-type intramembrane protease [Motiliproteus sp.]
MRLGDQTNHYLLGVATIAAPAFWLTSILFGVFTWQPSLKVVTTSFFIESALIYPVLEELFFRGWLQGKLKSYAWGAYRLWGISVANLVAALSFALLHLQSQPALWAVLIIFPGLIFGSLKDRYNTVVPSVLMHVYYNAGFFILMNR